MGSLPNSATFSHAYSLPPSPVTPCHDARPSLKSYYFHPPRAFHNHITSMDRFPYKSIVSVTATCHGSRGSRPDVACSRRFSPPLSCYQPDASTSHERIEKNYQKSKKLFIRSTANTRSREYETRQLAACLARSDLLPPVFRMFKAFCKSCVFRRSEPGWIADP
jgi:hypothetical protein